MRLWLASLLCAAVSATAVAETIVTFQNGVDGYSGAFDRRISLTANENGADVETTTAQFFIDGDPEDDSRADYLIRFDDILGGAGIPAGATILDAQLELTTTSEAVNGFSDTTESFNLYRLTAPFDGTVTLDGTYGDGDTAFTNFVDGIEPEQGEADLILGTFDHAPDAGLIDFDSVQTATVTRAVQSWVNGDPNYGIAVVSDHRDNDNGWSVHSTGSATPSLRPKLSVTYTTSPAFNVVELQDGLNGYDGTTDVIISQSDEDGTTIGGNVSEAFLDGPNDEGTSPDAPLLIQFDLDGVEGKVSKAELIFVTGFSSGASDSGGPYAVHQLLTPFDESSQYGNFAGQVGDMLSAGEIGPEVDRFVSIDEGEVVSVDVSSIVANWLDGDTNYGFYVGANGTSNGWQIFTSGAADPDLAPMLRITLIPEPTSAALVALAVAGLVGAGRRNG